VSVASELGADLIGCVRELLLRGAAQCMPGSSSLARRPARRNCNISLAFVRRRSCCWAISNAE